jgi:2,4-diaminopentanoate dehydrogenase
VYRVIQWATGAMGRATLRTVIDHPDTELVGVFTYSPDKAGRDAGELAGRPPTGVLATSDLDTLLALDADVVVHAGMLKPYAEHVDDYVALLASGNWRRPRPGCAATSSASR